MIVSLLVAINWTNHIKGQWDQYDQLLTAQILLSAQERGHTYTMTERAEDSVFDPRVARSLVVEAERFAETTSAPTRRIARLAASLPMPAEIPPGTTVVVHEVSEQLPAIQAEISVVDEKGVFLAGLSRIDFEIFNGANRARLVQAAPSKRTVETQAIAVLLDCSASMKGLPLTTAKEVAANFCIQNANPNRIQLWRFSDSATAMTSFTIDSDVLVQAIRSIGAENGTALYQAIQNATLSLSQRHERRSLIVLTDGEDSFNTISPQSLIELCRQHNVVLHAVALGAPKNGHGPLEEMVSSTGGTFHRTADAHQLPSAFQEIAERLRRPIYRVVIMDPVDRSQAVSLHMNGQFMTHILPAREN